MIKSRPLYNFEVKVPSLLLLFGLLGDRLVDRLAVTRSGSVHRLLLHLAVRILTVSRLRSLSITRLSRQSLLNVARLYVSGWLGLAYIMNRGH